MNPFLDEATHDSDQDSVAQLQEVVFRVTGSACASCRTAILCGHEALISAALGLKNRPVCLRCAALGLGRTAVDLRDSLQRHFQQRECFGTVWDQVTAREPRDAVGRPLCLWSLTEQQPSTTPETTDTPGYFGGLPQAGPSEPRIETWDAGDLACGEMLLELRQRMSRLPPASTLKLIARDPGARADIPAWCHITGNLLQWASHPHYHIERKRDIPPAD
ncbi:MAG: sulfurtransferase TusA family protein [Pirellulaceae bacterium]